MTVTATPATAKITNSARRTPQGNGTTRLPSAKAVHNPNKREQSAGKPNLTS